MRGMRPEVGNSDHDGVVVRAFLLSSLVAMVLAGSGHAGRLALEECNVAGVNARCGTLSVPENRAEPGGRRIQLNVVVIPAREQPARSDAFTYLAGGPGGAATSMASSVLSFWIGVNTHRDVVLVDQRGTGDSNALECPRTRMLGSVGALRKYVRSCLRNLGGDWCNEPWVGLASQGPWHTYLDGSTRSNLALYRTVCSAFPRRVEPAAAWRRPHSNVPLLALVGGADPQDPLGNLTGLRRGMKNARIVVVPGMGHTVGQYGCLGALVSRFVDRGGAKALDTSCVLSISSQPFLVDA